MGPNILVTGAAGYIGGSVLAELKHRESGPIKTANIVATVRSEEQVQSVSKIGVEVIQLDLSDETAVQQAVLSNKIDIIVHTASSFTPPMVSHLIKALGQRRQVTGEEPYFIQSSLTTVYSAEAGWPYGEVSDTDSIFDKEKELGGSHPVRETNNLVTELAQAEGVKSFIIAVPNVYGRGTGEVRKLSVAIPAIIRTSIQHKVVYKFDKNGSPAAAHIADLSELYALLVEKILSKEPVPTGSEGYYFAMAHRGPWWDVIQRLAEALYARGLVKEREPRIWPSDEMAADCLGFPRPYVRAMGTASGELVPVNAYRLGWQPKWDEKRFLQSIDDEVQAVQELDTVKATLFEPLLAASKG